MPMSEGAATTGRRPMIEAVIEKLIAMKLYGMSEGLKEQINDVYRDLSFEDRFGLLIDKEKFYRENRQIKTLLSHARLRHPNACFEDIDFRTGRGLSKDTILRTREKIGMALFFVIPADPVSQYGAGVGIQKFQLLTKSLGSRFRGNDGQNPIFSQLLRFIRDELMDQIIEHRDHPEHGFRSCLGIIRLSKTYSPERVEAACKRALELKAYNYKSIKSLLTRNLENQSTAAAKNIIPLHANVRGGSYYREVAHD